MEDGKGGVFVRGLEEELETTANEIYKILEKGSARRCTAEEAIEILVGGKENAWKIPSSESDSLNKWAGSSVSASATLSVIYVLNKLHFVTLFLFAFLSLYITVWKYDSGQDSVLGPFYFISGAKGHCEQGQKLVVVVLSPRHSYTGISPAPSPAEIEGPAVAPTSNGSGDDYFIHYFNLSSSIVPFDYKN
ncbi:nuclear nucleic acid-binding protein C1D [Hibiscus syriacus]|uniref:Nuclear nucleic acid-binding protein C1D n=1 Tax=Hibiscus syriacus TaxID=106335 RepID=A0A6A3BUD1_HIBSY|nr:nuclear nucleic acid-binding protein C1D [Hibiscus syriacus]KAE8720456.1 nuclear nucleic acid-binding protein C1D [Hibiscus syriacus]